MDEWPKLVPELLVTDLAASLAFWCGLLGFRVVYDRPESGFSCLDLNGARVMLEQQTATERQWRTAPLDPPLGRGVNFEIEVNDLTPILLRLAAASWPLFMPPEEKWYRTGDTEAGQRQFLVQDPDGYLVRLITDLGESPA